MAVLPPVILKLEGSLGVAMASRRTKAAEYQSSRITA